MIVSLRTSEITVSIRKQHHLPENDIKLSKGRILTLGSLSQTSFCYYRPMLRCVPHTFSGSLLLSDDLKPGGKRRLARAARMNCAAGPSWTGRFRGVYFEL